jgi:hypothetical protein
LLVALIPMLAGCGGSKAAPGATAADTPASQEVPWAKKTRQQRLEFMGKVVYPRMRQLFRTYDPEQYEGFRCQTCHGDDMEKRNYAMPNSLYSLPEADPMKEAESYDPRIAKFMADQVLPTMAEMLGIPAGSKSAVGFSCFNCHPKEE